jgi:hypothetical protein
MVRMLCANVSAADSELKSPTIAPCHLGLMTVT